MERVFREAAIMVPCNFDESNIVFDKPNTMSHDECESLSCFKGTDSEGNEVIISCWKITKEELEEILATGRIWIYHLGGYLQPHYCGGNNPFKKEES